MNAKHNPTVEVLWHDAHSDGGSWMEPHAWLETIDSPYVVRSVGYLLRDSKREIVIAQSKTDKGRISDTITIPRGMVRRVTRLK